MEITWTWNWLETVGFVVLLLFGGFYLLRFLLQLWLYLKFKGKI